MRVKKRKHEFSEKLRNMSQEKRSLISISVFTTALGILHVLTMYFLKSCMVDAIYISDFHRFLAPITLSYLYFVMPPFMLAFSLVTYLLEVHYKRVKRTVSRTLFFIFYPLLYGVIIIWVGLMIQ